ncbi:MAG: TetR/AcrR family transcriptional regulator [Paracoccaceae bacterium]|jgi:AcrR family transcriptional regulator
MPRTIGSYSQNTQTLVRQSAERLFARHGYAAVSMRQLASDVGVQVGTIYNYTKDKQTLLFTIMSEHMTELLLAWSREGLRLDPIAQLSRFLNFHLDYHLARRDAVFIAYMELRNLDDTNFAQIETLRRQYEDALEQILVAGKNTKSFDVADTRITTLAIIGMLTEVVTWYREDGRLKLDEVKSHYRKMVLRMVVPRTEPYCE